MTHDLGDLRELAEGDMRCFPGVGEYGTIVCRVGGGLYALDDNCPGCDVPLNRGWLDAFHLTCREHEGWFDVRDGSANGAPAPPPARVHPLDGPEHAVRIHIETADA